ncbi:transglutaminase domain-containing protein [Streptococcus dysgalactiae]|uniref:transglutaminase domain-containing protein n=1 Tax=Streptococcus dysgalactiae TaxID=1334 RepID=UPI001FA9887C|nr:transglutaminase domain-containing protein [Streptococcus dysgalactiae]
MKIKKIVSGLAAALLLSSFSVIDNHVKADEMTNGYRYYVSEQDTYYQAINYLNQQRDSLYQFVRDNVNGFGHISAQGAVERLNHAIVLANQTNAQLVDNINNRRLGKHDYNSVIAERAQLKATISQKVNDYQQQLSTIQGRYQSILEAHNVAIDQINAALQDIQPNGINNVEQAKTMLQAVADRVNPLVEQIRAGKAELFQLQTELDNLSTEGLEADITSLANLSTGKRVPAHQATSPAVTEVEPASENVDSSAYETTETHVPAPVDTNTSADYEQLKNILKQNIANHAPHINVEMTFKTQAEVDTYQQRLGAILHELGDYYGTLTSFASQSRISTYTLGGQIQHIVVNSDITVTYTLKDDLVALHQEYKNFVANFVRDNITAKNITSDYDKAKVIHDHLVNEYTYATEELASNRETVSGISIHAPEALYRDKRGVCQAYAVMFKDMAEAAGLSAWYVTGKGLNENHAWNIVTIDGVNYYVDATWNDSAHTTRYFLAGKDVMDTEHRLDSQYEHLTHSIPSTNYHRA